MHESEDSISLLPDASDKQWRSFSHSPHELNRYEFVIHQSLFEYEELPIHSDIERGFIKAEIVSYDDLIREGSMNAAKEKGLVRSEGKEYIMQDGDIVLFKFNV